MKKVCLGVSIVMLVKYTDKDRKKSRNDKLESERKGAILTIV